MVIKKKTTQPTNGTTTVISANTKGNPLHVGGGVPEGGQFTSKDNTVSFKNIMDYFQANKETYDVPRLQTHDEVWKNIDKIISGQFVTNVFNSVESDFNRAGTYYNSIQVKDKNGNDLCKTNPFVSNLGMFRYRHNYAQALTPEQFYKIMSSSEYLTRLKNGYYADDIDFTPIIRGVKGRNFVGALEVADGYFRHNNLFIYGSAGAYGTNVYTSTAYSYTVGYGYADSYELNPNYNSICIKGYLNTRDAYSRTSNQINTSRRQFVAKYGSELRNFLTEIALKNGKTEEQAYNFTDCFMDTLERDEGLYAVMQGVDYLINESHQRNILNLSRWYILKEW